MNPDFHIWQPFCRNLEAAAIPYRELYRESENKGEQTRLSNFYQNALAAHNPMQEGSTIIMSKNISLYNLLNSPFFR